MQISCWGYNANNKKEAEQQQRFQEIDTSASGVL